MLELDQRFKYRNGWLDVLDENGEDLGSYKKAPNSLRKQNDKTGMSIEVTSGMWASLPDWARKGTREKLEL